jgi:hypothetical protein
MSAESPANVETPRYRQVLDEVLGMIRNDRVGCPRVNNWGDSSESL